jgi:hypothetical protein
VTASLWTAGRNRASSFSIFAIALCLTFLANSANAQSDSQPPVLEDVHATTTSITIVFDEPLDPVSATDASNYTLDDDPVISLTQVLYTAGQTAVTLVTSAHDGAASYTIVVDGVMDVAGNAMSVESVDYAVVVSSLDKSGTQWIPYIEWELTNTGWSGNPYDVVADATFSHTGSDATHTTQMFYVGGDNWRFRFSGTQIGEWTFVTSSATEQGLSAQNGTVIILPNAAPAARGFVAGNETTWIWSGTGDAFVPQLAMYAIPIYFSEKPAQIDSDINTFMVEHGFNGLHVVGTAHWFDIESETSDQINAIYGEDPNAWITAADPDPRTFEALELLITKVYLAGGNVHLWAWGDNARRWNPTLIGGGLNGPEDQRLQRYIAARLGALPGWTMSYGFDLDEWVTEAQLGVWVAYMRDHLGWSHMLGARPEDPNFPSDPMPPVSWNQQMDYSSYEHWEPSYDVYVEALTQNIVPAQPAMSEDRFRLSNDVQPKDYTMEQTRRGLWHSTLAGGVANIWGVELVRPEVSDGDRPSLPYENPEFIQTYSTFFATRFVQGVSRCNDLITVSESEIGYGLCYPTNDR